MFNWILKRRPRNVRRSVFCRACLTLEHLEGRELPAVLSPGAAALGQFFDSAKDHSESNVYVESNNPAAGQNAVLAYHSNSVSGAIAQFGTFATGGTGQINLPKAVGPDDGDHQIVTSSDGRFLYAVNEGGTRSLRSGSWVTVASTSSARWTPAASSRTV